MRKYPSRSYGTLDNDSTSSVFLFPDEKPRTAYPMPDDDVCPKCGNRCGNVFRPGKYFRCYKCCLIVDEVEFVPAMPMTEELKGREVKGGIEIVKLTCPACGREFRTRANNPHGICQRCRNRQTAREWAKEHPEEYRMIQAKYKGKYREKQKQQRMKGLDDAYAG